MWDLNGERIVQPFSVEDFFFVCSSRKIIDINITIEYFCDTTVSISIRVKIKKIAPPPTYVVKIVRHTLKYRADWREQRQIHTT